MIYNLLLIYSVIAITAANQRKYNKTGNKGQNINVALQTVLEFNNENNADVKMLENLEKLIDKVKTAIRNKIQRLSSDEDRKTFTSFIQSVIITINKYNDKQLKFFFSIIKKEISKLYYKGSKFQELNENHHLKIFLNLLNQPISVIRKYLKMIENKIQEEKYDKKEQEFVNFINSLHGQESNTKYDNFLKKIDEYRLNQTNNRDLAKTVKKSIKSLISNYHSQLNKIIICALNLIIGDIWNPSMRMYANMSQDHVRNIASNIKTSVSFKENNLKTLRQMYVEKNIDLKYDPYAYDKLRKEASNKFNTENYFYNSRDLLTHNPTTRNLKSLHVPPTKRYTINKPRVSLFKKSRPTSLRSFRKMFEYKNTKPYGQSLITDNANKFSIWTLYTTFNTDGNFYNLDPTKLYPSYSFKEHIKRVNKKDKIQEESFEINKMHKPKNYRALVLSGQNGSPTVNKLGLPLQNKYKKEPKANNAKQSKKWTLKEPIQHFREVLSRQINQIHKKEKITKIGLSNRHSTEVPTDRKYFDSEINSSEGLSIEGIEVIPTKFYARRTFTYSISPISSVINKKILTKLQNLEDEIKVIRNHLVNETDTINYLNLKLRRLKHSQNYPKIFRERRKNYNIKGLNGKSYPGFTKQDLLSGKNVNYTWNRNSNLEHDYLTNNNSNSFNSQVQIKQQIKSNIDTSPDPNFIKNEINAGDWINGLQKTNDKIISDNYNTTNKYNLNEYTPYMYADPFNNISDSRVSEHNSAMNMRELQRVTRNYLNPYKNNSNINNQYKFMDFARFTSSLDIKINSSKNSNYGFSETKFYPKDNHRSFDSDLHQNIITRHKFNFTDIISLRANTPVISTSSENNISLAQLIRTQKVTNLNSLEKTNIGSHTVTQKPNKRFSIIRNYIDLKYNDNGSIYETLTQRPLSKISDGFVTQADKTDVTLIINALNTSRHTESLSNKMPFEENEEYQNKVLKTDIMRNFSISSNNQTTDIAVFYNT